MATFGSPFLLAIWLFLVIISPKAISEQFLLALVRFLVNWQSRNQHQGGIKQASTRNARLHRSETSTQCDRFARPLAVFLESLRSRASLARTFSPARQILCFSVLFFCNWMAGAPTELKWGWQLSSNAEGPVPARGSIRPARGTKRPQSAPPRPAVPRVPPFSSASASSSAPAAAPPLRDDAPGRLERRRGAMPALASEGERAEALRLLTEGIYAPTTAKASLHKLNTVTTALAKFGLSLLPPDTEKVTALGAVLKAGGVPLSGSVLHHLSRPPRALRLHPRRAPHEGFQGRSSVLPKGSRGRSQGTGSSSRQARHAPRGDRAMVPRRANSRSELDCRRGLVPHTGSGALYLQGIPCGDLRQGHAVTDRYVASAGLEVGSDGHRDVSDPRLLLRRPAFRRLPGARHLGSAPRSPKDVPGSLVEGERLRLGPPPLSGHPGAPSGKRGHVRLYPRSGRPSRGTTFLTRHGRTGYGAQPSGNRRTRAGTGRSRRMGNPAPGPVGIEGDPFLHPPGGPRSFIHVGQAGSRQPEVRTGRCPPSRRGQVESNYREARPGGAPYVQPGPSFLSGSHDQAGRPPRAQVAPLRGPTASCFL